MNKLKLDLDALAVESFAPAADAPPARGTVRGRDALTDAMECVGANMASDYECSFDCSMQTCSNDEQCLAATLPPKCL